jgi:2-oxoglutarate dehydrogenase E2 component (dihydrolipoamide succinyltransferase)
MPTLVEAFGTSVATVKLTLTAYFVEAACKALQAVPEVNARWHDDALEIFEDVNIGVGTALEERGLIVPVIRRVQTLDLFGIALRLDELTRAARENRLTPADVQGGTFTISNHGVGGSLVATPIVINQPQVAILGVGKIQKRAVVVGEAGQDRIVARPMAYVTLSIDHRALDAYQTNRFLSVLVEALESR